MSFLQMLGTRAAKTPDEILYTHVGDDGRDADAMSVGTTVRDADRVARQLLDAGLKPGDRALLVYPPGLAFVRALLGAMVAGVVPVPVAPPNPFRLSQDLPPLAAIAASCGARAVLADETFASLRSLVQGHPALEVPWIPTRGADGLVPERSPLPSDVALLQYTSGSTSAPKGVRITWGNLDHQLGATADVLGLGPDARMVMWVPHFHDFGLISGILSAAYGNGALWMLSPLAFAQRPAVWLDVMSRVRATHTAAPNFAYDLVTRRTTPEQRRAWDLRSVRVTMSAAEPIRPDTVRAFLDAMASAGLDPAAFCPAYGLAEHTVGVTLRGRARTARGEVGCGRPAPGVSVRIVDPDNRRPAASGEIWVSSPSVADGYEGLPELSREVFGATIEGEPGTWLRTGDLGFLHDGEIVVSGRLKDLIIVRGRNVYPEDVEQTVRTAHPDVRPGGIAAFALPSAADTGDSLGLVVEVKTADADAVARAVREAVSRVHGLAVPTLVLAAPGAVPKTSSGKVRRRACRERMEAGELATILVSREAERLTLGDLVAPMDAGFRALAGRLGGWFARASRERGGRVFHKEATTGLGWIDLDPEDGVPVHGILAPGRRFPVLVRHANGVQEDDAAVDNRGATVRILDPGRPGDLSASILDLLLTTGRCFLAPTAAGFAAWMGGDAASREAIARSSPHVAAAAWEMFRAPASYAAVHYHGKTASAWGGRYVRFRLRTPGSDDSGFVATTSLLPPDAIPRDPADTRSRTFLHEEWRARLPVTYDLEVQVADAEAAALDCTRPWDLPWRRFGRIELDRLADPAVVEGLRFSSRNAPADLAPPRARSAQEFASLEHLRQIVYEVAACARAGEPLPAILAGLAEDRPSHRVCVIGAGASGLSAAFHLDRLGHRVTVLEAAPSIAGKCASIGVDGLPYDLGGHLCTPRYLATARLAKAVGAEMEPATPTMLWNGDVVPWDEGPALREAFLKYRSIRETELVAMDRPGNADLRGLAEPVGAWLASRGLSAFAAGVGGSYTSTGYGYLDDPEIPALYFLRAAETAGLLDRRPSDLPRYWTIRGGMQSLWERVAARLDVRCGARVSAVERRDGKVRVRVQGETLEFDRLVLAMPLDDALPFLDATLEERDLFGRIRYLDYHTVVARATGLPESGFYIPAENVASRDRSGRCVAFHHRHPGSDVVLFYAYGRSEDEVERQIRADVASWGGAVHEVLLRRRWKYFPHFGPDDLAAGAHDRLEALQGRHSTWYVGGLLGFELIENNVAYSEDLVRRHFGAPAEKAASEARTRDPVSAATIAGWIADGVAANRPGTRVDPDASLEALGLDSLGVTTLVTGLSDKLGWSVTTTVLYEHRTVARIAAALARRDLVEVGRATPGPVVVPTDARRPAVRVTGPRDMASVRDYWRRTFGIGPWPFEDLLFGFCDRFVDKVVFEDEASFAAVRDRGCVYLANHQVATEPAMLSTLMSGLSGKPLVGLAKIEGRDTVLGWFMEHMFSYPGVDVPKTWTYLDRSKPQELALRLAELTEHLKMNRSNVLIHVQGTRSVTCREPVRLVNPMMIEMAIATGAPILPVRLVGGLPVEPLAEKLDVPVGYGRQTYWIGRPILADELARLGFSARTERVLTAINGLGPSNDAEEPSPPDPAFAARVAARKAAGFPDFWSVVYEVAAELPDPSPGTRRILEGVENGRFVVGEGPEERWLGALAAQIYGGAVPVVTTAGHSFTTA